MSVDTLGDPGPTQTLPQHLRSETDGQMDLPFYSHPEQGGMIPPINVVVGGLRRRASEIRDVLQEKVPVHDREPDAFDASVGEAVKTKVTTGANLPLPEPQTRGQEAKLGQSQDLVSTRNGLQAQLRTLNRELSSLPDSLRGSKANRDKARQARTIEKSLGKIDKKLGRITKNAPAETADDTPRQERYEQPELPMTKEPVVPENTSIYEKGHLFPRDAWVDGKAPLVFEGNLPLMERHQIEQQRVADFEAKQQAERQARRSKNRDYLTLIDPLGILSDEDAQKMKDLEADVTDTIHGRAVQEKERQGITKGKLPPEEFQPLATQAQDDVIEAAIANGDVPEGWSADRLKDLLGQMYAFREAKRKAQQRRSS